MKSITEVIKFLASVNLHFVDDMFLRRLEFTLKKDSFLAECASIIPQNAKYTFPEISNEIIEVMAKFVRESVVSDIKNAEVSIKTTGKT